MGNWTVKQPYYILMMNNAIHLKCILTIFSLEIFVTCKWQLIAKQKIKFLVQVRLESFYTLSCELGL